MARRERIENDATSTLNGAIDNSTTSVVVTSASTFPSEGDFRILIDSEIMLVTAVSGATFTVVRAQEGTTAASHDTGQAVIHLATREGMGNFARQNGVPLFNATGRPPIVCRNQAGTNLTISDFTAYNQGSATAADIAGSCGFSCYMPPQAANNLRVWAKAAPTPPWTLSVFCGGLADPQGTQIMIGAKETGASGKLSSVFNRFNATGTHHWTSPTVFDVSANLVDCSGMALGFWLRVEDDNTNLDFSISCDGVTWKQVGTELRTSYLSSVDQLFFGLNDNNNTFGLLASIWAWVEE